MSEYLTNLALRGAGLTPAASPQHPSAGDFAALEWGAGEGRDDPQLPAPLAEQPWPGSAQPAESANAASPAAGRREIEEGRAAIERAPLEPAPDLPRPAMLQGRVESAPQPAGPTGDRSLQDSPLQASAHSTGSASQAGSLPAPSILGAEGTALPVAAESRPTGPAVQPGAQEFLTLLPARGERSGEREAAPLDGQSAAPSSRRPAGLGPEDRLPFIEARQSAVGGPMPRLEVEMPLTGRTPSESAPGGEEDTAIEVNIGTIEVQLQETRLDQQPPGGEGPTGFEEYSLARRGLDRRWY